MPQNWSTTSYTQWTQHISVTSFSSLEGTWYGLCHRLARVYDIRMCWDLGIRRTFHYNGNQSLMHKGHWLVRVVTSILCTHDLWMWCTRQFYQQFLQLFHQSVLGHSWFQPPWKSLIVSCISPADSWSTWAADPNDVSIPCSLLRLRAGQHDGTVAAVGLHVQQLHPRLHTDDTLLGECQLRSDFANSSSPKNPVSDHRCRLMHG